MPVKPLSSALGQSQDDILCAHTPSSRLAWPGGKKIKKKERDEILGELMTGSGGAKQQHPQDAHAAAGKGRAGALVRSWETLQHCCERMHCAFLCSE